MTTKERAGMPKRSAVNSEDGGESRLLTESPRRKRWRVNRDVKLFPVILVALTLISGGVAGAMYFKWYRPDQQTNPGVEQTVLRAASDGTVALLSYSPDSLDKD